MTSPDMTAVPFGVSRLKRKITWSLDSRKANLRNADGAFLSGLSLKALIVATHSLTMDGPRPLAISQLATPNPLST
jgi:uncharacterized sodium:solute symporter family permease YidK